MQRFFTFVLFTLGVLSGYSQSIQVSYDASGARIQRKASGCTAPSAPTLTKTAGTTVCTATNQTVTLTASGCSGTVTWYQDGNQIGTGASITRSSPGNYTATCTVGGCTSAVSQALAVTQTSGCGGSSNIQLTLSVWKAGASGVRTKIKDLVDGDQILLSSFGGSQANWFIDITGGQISNTSGTNNYNKVSLYLNGPGYSNHGWGPEDITTPNAGNPPYGLNGKDGGSAPNLGTNYQLTGKVYFNNTELASKTVNFSIVNTTTSCNFTPTLTGPSTSPVNTGSTFTLTAACTGGDCGDVAYAWSGPGASGAGTSKTITAPSTAGTYTYTVTASRSGCANKTASKNIPVSSPSSGSGTGLTGNYYNNMDLSGAAALTRVDPTVDFDWGAASPGAGVNADMFSVRWEGQVEAPVTGSYTFKTNDDDGSRLWVNGVLLIDDWIPHGPTPMQGTISLTAGQKYSIKKEYFDSGGGAVSRLYWSYPGQAEQVVPQSRLFPSGGLCSAPAAPSLSASPSSISAGGTSTLSASGCSGTITWSHGLGTGSSKTVSPSSTTTYTATCTVSGCVSSAASVTVNVGGGGSGSGTGLAAGYYNNTTFTGSPVLTRVDPTINFDWGGGSPGTGVNIDNFAVRWEGQVEAPVTGSYTFKTNDDDGSRLWVNGVLLIDDWNPHGPTPMQGTISLTAGQKYSIKKEYFDSGGGAESRLFWSYPGQSEQVVPQARLYPGGCTTPSAPTLAQTSGTTVCSVSNPLQTVTLTATGCSGTVTWYRSGVNVGIGGPFVTTSPGTYTTTCTVNGCTSGPSNAVVVSQTPGCGSTATDCYTLRLLSNAKYLTNVNGVLKVKSGDGSNSQVWKIETIGSHVRVTAQDGTNRVIGVANGGQTDYDPLTLQSYTGGDHQLWTKQLVTDSNPGDKYGFIRKNAPFIWSSRLNWGDGDPSDAVTDILLAPSSELNTHGANKWYLESKTCPANSGARSGVAEDTGGSLDLKVSPNPNRGVFEVSFFMADQLPARLSVVDALGRTVHERTVKGYGAHRQTVRLPETSLGMFIVLLRTGTGTETRKIVVIR